jgi:MATE family multidrug resistance protein
MSAIRAQVPGILALAVPITAGLAASTLMGAVDAVMLAPLGPVPLAAVGLTSAATVVLYAAVWGTLMVTSVRIGSAFGAGQGRRIPFLLRNALVLGVITGAVAAGLMAAAWLLLPYLGQPAEVLAALPGYWAAITAATLPFAVLTVFKAAFEAVGRPWLGTGFALLAVAVNVPLNWLLIWGAGPVPALGLTGAGLATLLAETLALAAAWALWRFGRSTRRLRLRRGLDAAEIGAALREGAPLGALYVAETGAMAVATLLVGTFGTLALAANQVAMAVGNVLYMVPLGVAGAVAIRVAQEKGAGNSAALRPVALAALAVATLWLAGSALFLWLAGSAVAGLITGDAAVAALAATIMAVFALMQVFDGLQSTMVGALRGLSDTGFPAAVTVAAYWGCALPLAWALSVGLGLGPAFVWVGWLAALACVGAVLLLRFLHRTRAA